MPTPTTQQLIEQLQAHPFFSNLDTELIAQLAREAVWREYDAGEIVVLEGEALPGLYFLQSGWLKVVKLSLSGREQVLRFLETGETFNEIGIFANRPNPATIIALEPAGVWFIPKRGMRQLLRGNPDFAEQLIAELADRMLHFVSLVSNLSLLPVTGRLAHLVLTDATDGVLLRPRWYTQNELAARLGTVPDVVQRALRELEKEGLIEVQRHLIRILDQQGLQEKAGQ